MKKLNWMAMILLVATALVACPQSVTPQSVNNFTPENAWKGDVPADAKTISDDEFSRRVANGELVMVSTAGLEKQQAARQRQYQEDRAFLQGIDNKSVPVQELLKRAATTNVDGDVPVKLPNGNTVSLLGIGTQIRNEVESLKFAQDADNALAVYRMSYEVLPAALKAKSPAPEGLQGKTLAEINAARDQLENLLVQNPGSIKGARPDVSASGVAKSNGTLQAQALQAGNGRDNNNDSGCAAPSNFFAKFWFPLKYFISPIKDQGQRGTCWAFTAVGALESRERVQNNNAADISEQFFVHKNKLNWEPDDVGEGGSSDRALNLAVSKNQILPNEAFWTYNRSLSRPNTKSLKGVCTGYSPQGTCSETAHQSEELFVPGGKYKAYVNLNYSGVGVSSATTHQIWRNGETFRLQAIKNYLANGYAILTAFPVYKNFMNDVGNDGVVKHDDAQFSQEQVHVDEDSKQVLGGPAGNHLVQIVGFLSNNDLFGSASNNQYGGGYFIIKNSWGCLAGDGGYYYVPVDYVTRFFFSMSVLNFDSRRSDVWNNEQSTPGGSVAPSVDSRNVTADLRVAKDLSVAFTISHPVAKSVNLKLASDKDGVLYNGPWSTEVVLVGPGILATFSSIGTRTISLEANYNGRITTNSFTLNVINAAPKIALQNVGTPYQGQNYTFNAKITDINEADPTTLCSKTTWSVDAPDVLRSTTGCQVNVNFGKTGSRRVRAQTRDNDGLASEQVFADVQVFAPPTNPYPKIISAGVFSRELTGGLVKNCSSVTVPNGTTIDLSNTGCSIIFGDSPPRYLATAQVENPSNETLGYSWTLYLANGLNDFIPYTSSQADFALPPAGTSNVVTRACRVELKVIAPDPVRSKSQVVWNGQCTTPILTIK
jgi:C1A family cysteine protease